MRALLDVNVLLALLDGDHVHHELARDWFRDSVGDGWATCAITENGFVRILSQPGYPGSVPATVAAGLLKRAVAEPQHEFWSCEASILEEGVVDMSRVHGSRQVTDAYLLALAVSRRGRFVTFDRTISLSAVPEARPEHLVWI
jgi:toxin-antitoxin system PIN domain toxin